MQPLQFWNSETLLKDQVGNKPFPLIIMRDLQNKDDPDSDLAGVSNVSICYK